MFAMLSRLFIAALWSPEGKGLTSWLLFVMFIVILLLSHLVSWGSSSIPNPCCLSYYEIKEIKTKKYFIISKRAVTHDPDPTHLQKTKSPFGFQLDHHCNIKRGIKNPIFVSLASTIESP